MADKTLTQKLQDPQSEELALLSEMLHGNIKHMHDFTENHSTCRHGGIMSSYLCLKCDTEDLNRKPSNPCLYPDPITTDLRLLAWEVFDKMVELRLLTKWQDWMIENAIVPVSRKDNPHNWINAGISVFKRSKTC